jgi:acetyltransferase-like isoleucine patch superfamily enzyme
LINRSTSFEGMNSVMDHCEISSSLIGLGTYISSGSVVRKTRIGRFCSIGSGVRISLGRHPTSQLISTHPAFFSRKKQAGFTFVDSTLFAEHVLVDGSSYAVEIGSDVWIGNDASIADGVRIGNGAVIGTRALVTKDVEPFSVNVGIPARRLRYRFEPDTIRLLQQFRWWDKDVSWLERNAHLFADKEEFLRLIESSFL